MVYDPLAQRMKILLAREDNSGNALAVALCDMWLRLLPPAAENLKDRGLPKEAE